MTVAPPVRTFDARSGYLSLDGSLGAREEKLSRNRSLPAPRKNAVAGYSGDSALASQGDEVTIRRAVAAIAIVGAVLVGALPAGALTVSSRLLSATELPAGWTQARLSTSGLPEGTCLYVTSLVPANQEAQFHSKGKGGFTVLAELLATGKAQAARWQQLRSKLATCRGFAYAVGKKTITVKVVPLSFSRIGTSSSAYAAKFTTKGHAASDVVVLFKEDSVDGVLVYGGSQSASLGSLRGARLSRAELGSTRLATPLPTRAATRL